ncbi:hypothetical protein DH2020_036369 [Rehmannia glutinosa]|uniref:Carotenoid cleavage dioxygenase n=1 Tax=Rehmannia glutinosa TaxID=99300 RepID=A0ABR0V4Z8_REHGL
METLSSSFFQNSSPPLLLLQFNTPSVKIHVNSNRFTDKRPIKTRISSSIGTTVQTSTEPKITGRRKQSLLTDFFKSLDDFVCKFIDPPLRSTIDPKYVLAGNFAPVDELPPTACEVEEAPFRLASTAPTSATARTRSSPHAARTTSLTATTYKYTVEREIGFPVVINYFSAYTSLLATVARYTVAFGRVISGEYDVRRGTGNANTSVSHFGGKLFAHSESDLPYTIKLRSDGDIITLRRHEEYGEPLESMTAHPKVDRETGEAFAYRHNIQRPYLTYFRVNSDGIKQPEVKIFSKKQASLVHDFAITKNYAIFPDSQLVIRPAEIINGNQPALVDPTKVPKLGIIPRYAEDEKEMWWVEVPGYNCMHAANAWEEDGGDTIVMVATNLLSMEHFTDRPELVHSSMERLEINVKAKTVARRPISTRCLDFGVINPAYLGKKTRYIYAAVVFEGPKITGVVKLDLSLPTAESGDCTVASRFYGPGCYGGEPCFVPREPDNPTAEEDDGYIVNYVFNENTQESKFIVMNAKSPTLEIVAIVKLPQRVPYGFHGMFVRECDLQKL